MQPLPPPFLGETLLLHKVNGITLSENVYQRASRVARHTHQSSFFSLTLSGGYVETHRDADLEYGVGSVSFHPPYDEHSLRISDDATRCLNIELDADWLGRLREVSDDTELVRTESGPLLWLTARLHSAFHSPFPAGDIIQNLVLEMLGSVATRGDQPRDAREPRWLPSVDEMIRAEFLDQRHGVSISRGAREFIPCTSHERGAASADVRFRDTCTACASTRPAGCCPRGRWGSRRWRWKWGSRISRTSVTCSERTRGPRRAHSSGCLLSTRTTDLPATRNISRSSPSRNLCFMPARWKMRA